MLNFFKEYLYLTVLLANVKCFSWPVQGCLTHCMLGKFACFFVVCRFFSQINFWKIISEISSEYQTVWIQISILGPNCLQSYQQMTLTNKELIHHWWLFMQTWKYDKWDPGILTVSWERQFDFFAFHCYPSASASVSSKKLQYFNHTTVTCIHHSIK